MKSGRVRAIASTNPKRGSPHFADLPVLAETIPGFELLSWQAAMVACATPRTIMHRRNGDFLAVR